MVVRPLPPGVLGNGALTTLLYLGFAGTVVDQTVQPTPASLWLRTRPS